ncbi:MAG: response regulator [Candidatus Woesebacteria bacterium]
MPKILVVEDDKFLSNAYKVKFTKAGFEVLIASDGNEALLVMQSQIPDLILLDLVMPAMDGFAVLAKLKVDQKLNGIPVIVASNLGQKEDIEKALAMGATDFIIKSDVSLDEIVEKIKAKLHG